MTRTCFILLFVLGCGNNATNSSPDMATAATTYVPFSASNLAAQQNQVGAFEDIIALRTATGFDKSKCGNLSQPAAGTLAEAYTRGTTDSLQAAVKERKDEHSYGNDAPIGVAIDKTIGDALAGCSDGSLDPKVAAQLIEKSLVSFFFFSLYHEMVETPAFGDDRNKEWDEAFGYYGRSPEGATRKGFSAVAAARDMNFNLTLDDTIYRALIQGRAQLVARDANITQTIDKIDRNALLVVAYSTAREFAEFGELTDPAVEFAEAKALFVALEPYLKAQSAADAAYIRAQLDKTTYATAKSIDWTGIVTRLETAFGIDVTP